MGHSKGVHDIDFDNSGAQFMSAAYDRQMKLWDTETGTSALPSCTVFFWDRFTHCTSFHCRAGQCKQAFSNGKIP